MEHIGGSHAVCKVTIVTICLNCLPELKATLASALGQTFPSREIVVVDGGSSDGTADYLQQFEGSTSIRFVSEKDKGIYDAMNKGAKLAAGEYIIYMNAGDRFADADVLTDVFAHGSVSGKCPPIISGRVEFEYRGHRLGLYRPAVAGQEGPGLPHQATLIQRGLQLENPFDTALSYVGDYELWCRLKSRGQFNVTFIERVIAVFSLGGASTDVRHDMKRYFERCYVDYRYTRRFGVRQWLLLGGKVMARRVISTLGGTKALIYWLRALKSLRRVGSDR